MRAPPVQVTNEARNDALVCLSAPDGMGLAAPGLAVCEEGSVRLVRERKVEQGLSHSCIHLGLARSLAHNMAEKEGMLCEPSSDVGGHGDPRARSPCSSAPRRQLNMRHLVAFRF